MRFDLACAYLGRYSDVDLEYSMIDEILGGIIMLAKVQGAKKVKLPKRKKLVGSFEEIEFTTEEILSQLAVPGTVIERG